VPLVTALTVGIGFTVIEKLCGVPGQEFTVGVTEITPVTGEVPLFIALKEAMLPTPDVPIPIVELVFDQL
jgi:hypothetical protein